MTTPDLNLLVTLDALLDEGSVVRAARRLGLSASAMSRALSRLREATGDPLLVRAGRGLVATPRAAELREQVGRVVQEAEAILCPLELFDLRHLQRTFTFRNRDGFVENFGPDLIARISGEAPGVKLRFVIKTEKDSTPLRSGGVDLETAVIGKEMGPELRGVALFHDRFVGVIRPGHPLCTGAITAARYAAGRHVHVSRRGSDRGGVDEILERAGLRREVATIVGGHGEAIALARGSDLIATIPERYTGRLRAGMVTFPLPFEVPGITISLLWHPRLDADPAHRWLRACVREVCMQKPDAMLVDAG